MAKRVTRGRRKTHGDSHSNPTDSQAALLSGAAHTQHIGLVETRLARLLETPHLARIVPHLAPETLHQLIQHRGLDACGDLVASATPEQLTSVFDLDLWRNPQAGRDEQFDAERFGEWIEMLVETGESVAARTVAAIDHNLVVTGLSRYVRVFDPGVFEPTDQTDDEPREGYVDSRDDLSCEVGGYVVRARKTDAWDAIVALLVALESDQPAYFQKVMRGCQPLSNGTREIDGLDDLLMEPEQQLHDVALAREDRRTQRGYLTPADARAFLEMARQPRHEGSEASPAINPISAAFRAADEAVASAAEHAQHQSRARELRAADAGADSNIVNESTEASELNDVAESNEIAALLAEAGLIPDRPRALLAGATDQPSRVATIQRLLERLHDVDNLAFDARNRELAFLVNTLMAGGSVQGRPFTPQEASDAAVSICNLGLEHWPTGPDRLLVEIYGHDLVTAFEVGWAVLHQDVSLFAADRLVETLMNLRHMDADIQEGLRVLRREVQRQRAAGTPWRARDALEVIAMLDGPAWASLLGLFDECPVLPAALRATLEGRTRAVSPTDFEFISTRAQIEEVRAFMDRLGAVLTR